MSEKEKKILETIATAVPKMSEFDKYYFYTQNSGKDTVKSPLGMFQNYAIDNDLNYVYDKIKNYYELGTYALEWKTLF